MGRYWEVGWLGTSNFLRLFPLSAFTVVFKFEDGGLVESSGTGTVMLWLLSIAVLLLPINYGRGGLLRWLSAFHPALLRSSSITITIIIIDISIIVITIIVIVITIIIISIGGSRRWPPCVQWPPIAVNLTAATLPDT